MATTATLGATKPATTDYYDIDVYNANLDLIDAAIAQLDGDVTALETSNNLKQPKITVSGIIKGDGNGAMSKAQAGTDYQAPINAGTDYAIPAVDSAATLSTTWTGSAAPYTQSVDIAGMTTAKKIQVGLAASCTAAQYAAAAKAQLHCTAQSAGAITVTAFGEKPTVAIPIIVRVEG